jgi:hypothetical protein
MALTCLVPGGSFVIEMFRQMSGEVLEGRHRYRYPYGALGYSARGHERFGISLEWAGVRRYLPFEIWRAVLSAEMQLHVAQQLSQVNCLGGP